MMYTVYLSGPSVSVSAFGMVKVLSLGREDRANDDEVSSLFSPSSFSSCFLSPFCFISLEVELGDRGALGVVEEGDVVEEEDEDEETLEDSEGDVGGEDTGEGDKDLRGILGVEEIDTLPETERLGGQQLLQTR